MFTSIALMRPLFTCLSCGFISTLGREFTRHEGLCVCKGCKAEYGCDADVTRWIDEKLAAKEVLISPQAQGG